MLLLLFLKLVVFIVAVVMALFVRNVGINASGTSRSRFQLQRRDGDVKATGGQPFYVGQLDYGVLLLLGQHFLHVAALAELDVRGLGTDARNLPFEQERQRREREVWKIRIKTYRLPCMSGPDVIQFAINARVS